MHSTNNNQVTTQATATHPSHSGTTAVPPGKAARRKARKDVAWTCPVAGCGKYLKNRSKRQQHLRIHSGERPWPCPFAGCSKRFHRQYDLRIHTRSHTGDRPWPCLFAGCDKRFTTSGALHAHLSVHTRKRPQREPVQGFPFLTLAGRASQIGQEPDLMAQKAGGTEPAPHAGVPETAVAVQKPPCAAQTPLMPEMPSDEDDLPSPSSWLPAIMAEPTVPEYDLWQAMDPFDWTALWPL